MFIALYPGPGLASINVNNNEKHSCCGGGGGGGGVGRRGGGDPNSVEFAPRRLALPRRAAPWESGHRGRRRVNNDEQATTAATEGAPATHRPPAGPPVRPPGAPPTCRPAPPTSHLRRSCPGINERSATQRFHSPSRSFTFLLAVPAEPGGCVQPTSGAGECVAEESCLNSGRASGCVPLECSGYVQGKHRVRSVAACVC